MRSVEASVGALMVACGLSACTGSPVQPITTTNEAIQVADAYVSKKYPTVDRRVIKPTATDHGKYWLIRYDPPEGHAGGGPKLVIHKNTREVAAEFEDQ